MSLPGTPKQSYDDRRSHRRGISVDGSDLTFPENLSAHFTSPTSARSPTPEANSASSPSSQFLTQPPKLASRLTGKISTLFRREGRDKRARHVQTDVATVLSGPGPARLARDDDTKSGDSQSVVSHATSHSKRIFYSSHNDEDSDDSYESRISKQSRMSRALQKLHAKGTHRGGLAGRAGTSPQSLRRNDQPDALNPKTILRYRGFSTSIQSLFLDEALVCASMGCFGLILSNRTEYLLQLRNERRGMSSPRRNGGLTQSADRRKLPSRIVAYALLLTLLSMFGTFIIWGFGTGHGLASDYYTGYDYYDDSVKNSTSGASSSSSSYGNNNNNNNDGYIDDYSRAKYDDRYGNYYDDGVNNANENYNGNNRRLVSNSGGIYKLRDAGCIWSSVLDFLRSEWYRGDAIGSKASIFSESNVPWHHRREQQSTYYDTVDDVVVTAEYTRQQQDIGSNIRVALLFAFLLFLGVLGRRRRLRTRFYLVRARAQEDHLYYASSDVGTTKRVAFEDTRENQYEGACSHTLCGCYPVDEATAEEELDAEDVEVRDTGIFIRKKTPHHQDIVARFFSCFMSSCCGALCKCWFQCLSICALAQEAREVRLLVPPRFQRIDFITHQPFHEYQKTVTDLRLGWMGRAARLEGFLPHYTALSRLSRYVVVSGTISVIAIVATLVFNPRAAFSWQDAVVLAATFLQSFLVLFIVHWIFHKSDLSLDAVIKLFAAGFLIAVPAAFFFEGLLVNVVLFGAWGFYELLAVSLGPGFQSWVFNNWRVIWIMGEVFNAYVVAAVTEELCKYYTFRAVEHPDLLFLTGLDREKQHESAVDGGVVNYPFGCHNVQDHNKTNERDDMSVKSYRSNFSKSSRMSATSRKKPTVETLLDGDSDAEFLEDLEDVRTNRQKAMAITTGMISVAVGLACAENFLYVFVLGGAVGHDKTDRHRGDVLEAWIVLFFRSIFPVHALSAALQSINMIRKFVETSEDSGHRIGVGRIVLPAVLLHGSFDAVLMGINMFIDFSWDEYLDEHDGNIGDDEPYNSVLLNMVAWMSITTVMFTGIGWYYYQYSKQRRRLRELDLKDLSLRASHREIISQEWTPPSSDTLEFV